MKRLVLTSALLLGTAPAIAQQQTPDPAFLQKALSAMQSQRNQAADAQAVLEARLSMANDELAKAQAKIKELKAKPKAGDLVPAK